MHQQTSSLQDYLKTLMLWMDQMYLDVHNFSTVLKDEQPWNKLPPLSVTYISTVYSSKCKQCFEFRNVNDPEDLQNMFERMHMLIDPSKLVNTQLCKERNGSQD